MFSRSKATLQFYYFRQWCAQFREHIAKSGCDVEFKEKTIVLTFILSPENSSYTLKKSLWRKNMEDFVNRFIDTNLTETQIPCAKDQRMMVESFAIKCKFYTNTDFSFILLLRPNRIKLPRFNYPH